MIDIVRGWAIFVIVINHLSHAFIFYGLKGFSIPTPTSFGFSSAAEVFVMISGYMVGMVYLGRPNVGWKVLARATRLYLYNIGLFLLILPASYFMSAAEAGYWHISVPSGNEFQLLFRFTTLSYAPRLLDILQLYILLMLATPIAISAYRKSPFLLGFLSITLYLCVQILERYNGLPNTGMYMTFNPFAWQLAFFLPMILGVRKAHVMVLAAFEENPFYLILLAALFLSAGVAKLSGLDHYIPELWLAKSRICLGPLRLCHALLMVGLYFSLLVLARPVIHCLPFRVLACVGRNSLNCFSLSVVTTYALTLTWDRLGGGYMSYILSIVLSLSLTTLYAKIWDGQSRRIADIPSGGQATSVA